MSGTGKYEQVLERCRNFPPVVTAVAHPCEATALAGAIDAAQKWRFNPEVKNGKKVEGYARVPVTFNLNNL